MPIVITAAHNRTASSSASCRISGRRLSTGSHVDANTEDVLSVACEREEIQGAGTRPERHEKINIAARGLLTTRDRAEHPNVVGVSSSGRSEQFGPTRGDDLTEWGCRHKTPHARIVGAPSAPATRPQSSAQRSPPAFRCHRRPGPSKQ